MEHMRDIKLGNLYGELSVRAINGLFQEGCFTLEDVAMLPEKFIRKGIPNIGKVAAEEIIEFRKIMSSLCYLRVENRNAHEITVFDNMGGEIVISEYDQIAQLCFELITLRNLKWDSGNDDVEPDEPDDGEEGAIDIMVDPEDCFLRLEQGMNSISITNKEQAQSIAESLIMFVQEKENEI
jgi:hypothetical protein